MSLRVFHTVNIQSKMFIWFSCEYLIVKMLYLIFLIAENENKRKYYLLKKNYYKCNVQSRTMNVMDLQLLGVYIYICVTIYRKKLF